jgi:pantoate kinase
MLFRMSIALAVKATRLGADHPLPFGVGFGTAAAIAVVAISFCAA